MEAALDVTDKGTLEGKTVAIQGAGNVAGFMIDDLLGKGVGRVIATDIDAARCEELRAIYEGRPVEIRGVVRGDDSILGEPCDVLAPSALGGVLNPDTIPRINAPIVCGAANNQLLDDQRDDAALAERGIVYVPDFVANRMGIVNCANEAYGFVPHDPAFDRHFDRAWDASIFATTKKVLETARDGGVTTSDAANILADEACTVPHPIWGHRGWQIIEGLLADGWA
jgi:glutamate dehydrogenase/leucine dehydrogenase